MSLEIKSVNWCSIHRIQFPCDKPCPQCTPVQLEDLISELDKLGMASLNSGGKTVRQVIHGFKHRCTCKENVYACTVEWDEKCPVCVAPATPCCEHMPVEHFVAPDGWIVCNRCTCVRKPAAPDLRDLTPGEHRAVQRVYRKAAAAPAAPTKLVWSPTKSNRFGTIAETEAYNAAIDELAAAPPVTGAQGERELGREEVLSQLSTGLTDDIRASLAPLRAAPADRGREPREAVQREIPRLQRNLKYAVETRKEVEGFIAKVSDLCVALAASEEIKSRDL
jgi:hypothetical protein